MSSSTPSSFLDFFTNDDTTIGEIAEYGGIVIAASTVIYNLYTQNFSPFALLGGVLLGLIWWISLPFIKCVTYDGKDPLVCLGKSAAGVVADTGSAAAKAGASALTSFEDRILGKGTPAVEKYRDCQNYSSIVSGFMGPLDANCMGKAAVDATAHENPLQSIWNSLFGKKKSASSKSEDPFGGIDPGKYLQSYNKNPVPKKADPAVDPTAYETKSTAKIPAPNLPQINPDATLRYNPATKQWTVINIAVDRVNVYNSAKKIFASMKAMGKLDMSIFPKILAGCSASLSEVERQACVDSQGQIQQAALDVLNNTDNSPSDFNAQRALARKEDPSKQAAADRAVKAAAKNLGGLPDF